MLNRIKLLLGISGTEQDELLNVLIDICEQEALDYTHRKMGTEVSNIVLSMVVERYNKLGSEGITSRSFSGVSESITNNYSDAVIHQLNLKRKIRII